MIRNEIMKQTIEAMQQKRPVVNTHVNATFCFSGMFSEYAIGSGRKKSTTSVKTFMTSHPVYSFHTPLSLQFPGML